MPRKVLGVGGSGVTFSSGGVTSNVIPKEDGSGGLKDSALTDNGTVVTTTEPFRAADGAVGTPSYSFTNSTNTGMYQAANQLNFTVGGTQVLNVNTSGGNVLQIVGATGFLNFNNQTLLGNNGNAAPRFGNAANASPTAYTLQIGESSRGGTDSNVAGANGSIGPGIGTGTGVASKLSIVRNVMGATGSVAQTRADAFAVGQTKTLSNTSATAQTIATITLGSNAGGGCSGIFTIVSTDGTNFDSETQSFNVSFVNKATVVTVGTPAITASTAAVNSGTTSLGITAVANGNNIDIKVTPVFGTIVPTTVTLWPIITHSTGTVTFS